jgi:hypothetical protein
MALVDGEPGGRAFVVAPLSTVIELAASLAMS